MLRWGMLRQRRMRRAMRRLRRNQSGAAAVEFALVAAPFIAMLFAIIETAIVFFAGQVLETAVQDSARMIMTGQAQNGGFSQAQFKTQVCSHIVAMFDCNNGVQVDVRKFSSFNNVNLPNPVDANGNYNPNISYNPGGPGDIVVVRLFYLWPVIISPLGFNIADVNGSKRLIVATAAFRNEPY